MAIKEVYTSQEVAQFLSLTRQGVEWKANAERWQSQKRVGRGGGKEWLLSSMPEETRVATRVVTIPRAAQSYRGTLTRAAHATWGTGGYRRRVRHDAGHQAERTRAGTAWRKAQD